MLNGKRGDASLNRSSTLLSHYAASCGNSLPTLRDNIGPIFKGHEKFLTLKYGSDRLYRNVGRMCHYSLPNNPKQRSSYLLRGGRLKSLINHLSLARQRLLFQRQNLLLSRKHPHSSLFPVVAASCSFQSLSSNSLMPASVSPSPSSQLQNRRGLLLRLSFRLLNLKGVLLPNFNSIAEFDTLIKEVQQLERHLQRHHHHHHHRLALQPLVGFRLLSQVSPSSSILICPLPVFNF